MFQVAQPLAQHLVVVGRARQQVGARGRQALLQRVAALAQFVDRLLDVVALGLQLDDPLAKLDQRLGVLRRPAVVQLVEVEDLADLVEGFGGVPLMDVIRVETPGASVTKKGAALALENEA